MCSLFGILSYKNALSTDTRRRMLRSLGTACEARGTDATGIAYFDSNGLQIQKAPVKARRLKYRIPPEAQFIMGHTRFTTQGDAKHNYNNHPFSGRAGAVPFALAHNGIIYNDLMLRTLHALPHTRIETESYVAVQLLERKKLLDADSLRDCAEQLEGSFTLTVLTGDGIDIVRGNNPLCIYHFPAIGLYAYASTEELLREGLMPFVNMLPEYEPIQLTQGELLHIGMSGQLSRSTFDDSHLFPNYWHQYDYYYYEPPGDVDEYTQMVMEFATMEGISEDELTLLLDAGYDAMDLEELVFDKRLRKRCVDEILCGYR